MPLALLLWLLFCTVLRPCELDVLDGAVARCCCLLPLLLYSLFLPLLSWLFLSLFVLDVVVVALILADVGDVVGNFFVVV